MPDRPIHLVAGASSGMGRQAALALGDAGDHVVVAARRLDELEKLAGEIEAAGGSSEAMAFDGTDSASVAALIDRIGSAHGRLDGAFNNLGDTLGDSPLHETPPERWEATLAVNLTSVFHLMRHEIPLMLRGGGGRIVNTASTGGLRGTKAMSDYSAAKWGLIGLTRSAALDYADKGMIINAIAPGIIATEKFRAFEANMPELFESLRLATPAQRFGEMGEIADLVCWLLREAPGFMNGAVLPIDGGRTA
ncbi:MAG: SDR family NAD(P)-dependent oxidoreductase [Erythrobacter sp.]|uniref:SDR family NAD(P)-dependent oxidoreductase n=1 Tax=Erythrobacter sp. TaxID=1042 RepID=UPI0032EB7EFB